MIHKILNIEAGEFKRVETLVKNDKAFFDIQVSKIQIILLCKIMELDKRMKKLEEHCSTPLIH